MGEQEEERNRWHLAMSSSHTEITSISCLIRDVTSMNTRAEMTNAPSPWYTDAEMVEWDADFMR